ncbi:MAG: phage tail tape measure protein [Propionicimonas sp.]
MDSAARSAKQAAADTKSSWDDATSGAKKHHAELDRVGTGMLKAGALIAGGLAAATKAAMSWESAFAGVRKTVDELDPAFASLEGQLRAMARTMSTSHEDIAAVAEEAGALGVSTGDIAEFTRQMVILGETTNVTAQEAATSMAQFMTIMGTAPDKVGNLAAALVDLGNNGASTEAQILEMSQRIAGAGRAVGLTEAQVMGFASAIASTGMNVEAGGSAISRVFTKLDRIVTSGGAKLQTISDLVGTDFATAFRSDASSAVTMLIQSLGQLQDQGGSVTGFLDELGIKQIYETDVVRRLAGAHTLLADQLGMSGQAMDRGTAQLEEYAKRAQTTEFQTKAAWNSIKDAAIDAGNDMLPLVEDATQQVALLAQTFQDMPGPVRSAAVSLAAVTAGSLLLGGGISKGVVMVKNMITSMGNLGVSAGKAKLALGGLGLALGVGAIAYGVWADAAARAEQNAEDFAASLLVIDGKVVTTAATFDSVNQKMVTMKTGMLGWGPTVADLMDNLGVSAGLAQDYILGTAGATERLLDAMGGGPGASDLIAGLTEIRESMTEAQKQALQKAVADQTAGAQATQHADSMRNEAGAARSAETAMAGYTDELLAAGDAQLGLRGHHRAFEAAIDAAAEAVKRNGKTLDDSTRKGRENGEALDAIAASGKAVVNDLRNMDAPLDEVRAAMSTARSEYIAAAEAMGMGSEKAKGLADDLGLIPSEIYVKVKTDLDPSGINAWNAWQPKSKTAKIYTTPGGRKFTGEADGGILTTGTGGRLMRTYDDGGLALPPIGMQQPRIEHNRGERGIQWSETGAGPWEGFVSGHPGKRQRSRAVTEDIANRLGGDVMWRTAADGGILGGAPSHNGQTLDYWKDALLSPLEMTRLRIRIRDLERDLKAKEKYGKGKKKKTRLKLRGLDRTEAKQELDELKKQLADAKTAANLDASKLGTLEERVDAWDKASSATSGWAGFGGFNASPNQHTNANGDVWYTPTTGADYASQLKKHLADTEKFAGEVKALRGAGASDELIAAVEQEAEKDLGAGIAMADAFLSDRTALRSVNDSYARLSAVTGNATAAAAAAKGVPAASMAAGVGAVQATIADGAMAKALQGVALTLMVDGKPIRAIVRAETSAMAATVPYATGGVL